jgi:hypothetical protein
MMKKCETTAEFQEWADVSAYAQAEVTPWSPEHHMTQEALEVEALKMQGRLPSR